MDSTEFNKIAGAVLGAALMLMLINEVGNLLVENLENGQALDKFRTLVEAQGGDVTVLRSFEWKGYGCKEVRINNRAQGRQAENNLNWCKVEGKWRLVSEAQLGKN
mgnify:CR=1 FL=1